MLFFSVYDEARGMDDDDVLTKADADDRILITNDKEFGEKVFRQKRPHHGVILLRLSDERAASKIDALQKLLQVHAGRLTDRFVAVTDTRVRFAAPLIAALQTFT